MSPSRPHRSPGPPARPRSTALALGTLAVLAVLAGGGPHAQANTSPCAYQLSATTATDAFSSLTWQRVAPTATLYSLTQAQQYCAALMLNGSGPNVWRLPTIRELQTIVHEGVHHPALDTATFTDGLTVFFWTSTPLAAAPGNVWGVYFDIGNAATAAVDEMHAVRCVH